MYKKLATKNWSFVICFVSFFYFYPQMNANAEGRTYVSKKDTEVKYQICRLSKTERTPTSTSCYYKAQIPEDSVVVSTESPKTVCQREFACKIQ